MSTTYEGFTPEATMEKGLKFKKMATIRLAAARKAMRLLANTANTRTYFWTEEQKRKILAGLEESMDEVRRAFESKADNDFIEL